MLRRIKSELNQGRSLLQFGLLSAVGQALGMIAPLVIAKCLLPEVFASYSLAKMVMFFFLALLVSSTQTPFVVFGNQERARTGRIAATFTVQCLWLAVAVILFAGAAAALAPWIMRYAQITAAELVCLGAAFLALAGKTFLGSLAMALGRRLRNSLQEVAWGVGTLACVLALYAAGRLNISTVFLAYPVALAPVLLVSLGCLRDPALRPWKFDRSHHREMFRFAAWVTFGSLATFVAGWGDYFVLRKYMPLDQIGVYGLANQIFKGTLVLITVITAYFLPFVSEHIDNAEKMRQYLYRKRPRILLLGLAGLVLLFLGAEWLLRFAYGKAYEGAEPILLVLAIPSLLSLYVVFYIPIVNALKDYRFNTVTNLALAGLNLLVNLALVPSLGILGAALAAVAAHAAIAAAYELRFRLVHKRLLGL